MSRLTAAPEAVPIPRRDLPHAAVLRLPDEPPELELSDTPTEKGTDSAVAWYREVMGVPIAPKWVRDKTANRVLSSYLIGGAVWYSTRDLWRAVMSCRRSADDKAVAR